MLRILEHSSQILFHRISVHIPKKQQKQKRHKSKNIINDIYMDHGMIFITALAFTRANIPTTTKTNLKQQQQSNKYGIDESYNDFSSSSYEELNPLHLHPPLQSTFSLIQAWNPNNCALSPLLLSSTTAAPPQETEAIDNHSNKPYTPKQPKYMCRLRDYFLNQTTNTIQNDNNDNNNNLSSFLTRAVVPLGSKTPTTTPLPKKKQKSKKMSIRHWCPCLWMDVQTGIGYRTAIHLLLQLQTILLCSDNSEPPHDEKTLGQAIANALGMEFVVEVARGLFFGRWHLWLPSKKKKNGHDEKRHGSTISKQKSMGNPYLAYRFPLPSSSSSSPSLNDNEDYSNEQFSVKNSPHTSVIDKPKPHHSIPAYIYSSLRVIHYASSSSLSSNILSNALPICYTLLDDDVPISPFHYSYSSLGATLLLRLLDQRLHNNTHHDDDWISLWNSYVPTLLQVIQNARQSCRETPCLVFLTRIETIVLLQLRQEQEKEESEESWSNTRNHTKKHARESLSSPETKCRALTMDLLSFLRRLSHYGPSAEIGHNNDDDNDNNETTTTKQGLLSGILIGSLCPLLTIQAQTTESVECFRLGLSILFQNLLRPYHHHHGVVSSSSSSSSSSLLWRCDAVILSTLSALISLILGAHPIVHHHGGKLICELMSCLGQHHYHGNDDGTDDDDELAERNGLIHDCLMYTSSVILIFCKVRATKTMEQILSLSLEEEEEERSLSLLYPKSFLEGCWEEIQEGANFLEKKFGCLKEKD